MDINKTHYPEDEIESNSGYRDTAHVMAAAARSKEELRAAVEQELGMLDHVVYIGGLSTVGDYDARIYATADTMGVDVRWHTGASWAGALWTAWQLVVNGELKIGQHTPPTPPGDEEA